MITITSGKHTLGKLYMTHLCSKDNSLVFSEDKDVLHSVLQRLSGQQEKTKRK